MTTIQTTDYHTGGEPFRIVDRPPEIDGDTVAARRMTALASPQIDRLRRLLCYEPRGHADMYGGFITPPDDPGAHFGVLFWHKDGFSTACGHGTLALGTWAIESGRIPPSPAGVTEVVIDVPSGRVRARVRTSPDNRVESVDFINVPSYAITTALTVPTSRGDVEVAISYGGAIYAQVRASSVGLTIFPDDVTALIAFGREIKSRLEEHPLAEHPEDARLSGIYGTILWDDLGFDGAGRIHQRNVTVFADGEVDRSPCGSGTSARLATLVADGRMASGDQLLHESIVGSTFIGSVNAITNVRGRTEVATTVTGNAYRTGEHRFVTDDRDPITPGFVLR